MPGESLRVGSGALRFGGVAALVVAISLLVWSANRESPARMRSAAEETVEELDTRARREALAETRARKALKLRRQQWDLAEAQLKIIAFAMRSAARSEEVSAGVFEFAALERLLEQEGRWEPMPGIDAHVRLGERSREAPDTATWAAVLRISAGPLRTWVFDRVLRADDGRVFVGWTSERGVDASMMPMEEIPPSTADLVAAADPGAVLWCSLEAYHREDAYDPGVEAIVDDPAALRGLWSEAFAAAGRDATVTASHGAPVQLVVTGNSAHGDWPDSPTTLGYHPLMNTVAIQRSALRGFSAVSGLDMVADRQILQIALIHEAVHAHDHATSAALLAAHRSGDPDRDRAATLVLEGHAEFVAERVARELGLSDAWMRRQRALRRVVILMGSESAAALGVYDAGKSAIERVFERGGPEAVRALIAAPPASEHELSAE